jgi:hypothetical protein
MVIRTLINKSTTIKKDYTENYGLNPICMLSYGTDVSRALIHFDVKKLREMYNNKYFLDLSKLTHKLILKNCGSIVSKKYLDSLPNSDINGFKERAASFTVLAIKVNKNWDMGVGFDNHDDIWAVGDSSLSKDGATWTNATTEETWDENGIYDIDYIDSQYENFLLNGVMQNNIVVGVQKFDAGNEDFEIDITDYVNQLLSTNEENHGLCLMFTPQLEDTVRDVCQYVGFFNEKTNTVFTPILETRYDSNINDSRYNFYLNKKNKLYLYSIINDKLENLDELPICQIDGVKYEVKQETKGVYYIDIKLSNKEYKPNQIIYDIWSNLKYDGDLLDDVEMEFVTHSQNNFFKLSDTITTPKQLNPLLIGINNNEKITLGEIRLNKLFFKVPYTHNDYLLNDSAEYRLYIKDGDREFTVINWDKVMSMSKFGLFTIDTSTLVPAEYHLDIRVNFGEEIRCFKNLTTFTIVSDITKQKI